MERRCKAIDTAYFKYRDRSGKSVRFGGGVSSCTRAACKSKGCTDCSRLVSTPALERTTLPDTGEMGDCEWNFKIPTELHRNGLSPSRSDMA